MSAELRFSNFPKVLDDDAVEFVLRFEPDPRPALAVGGAAYRRGSERYVIEWPLDSLRLRAAVSSTDTECFVSASIGGILNEWWPLLMRSKPDSKRPLLSAAASSRVVRFTEPAQQLPLQVAFLRGGDDPPATCAFTKFTGAMTQENMLLAHVVSLGVIKAALLMLVEYRTLQATVPAVNITTEGTSLPLPTLIEVAEAATSAISWTHRPGSA